MHGAWDGIQPLGLPVGSSLVDVFDALGLFSVFSTPWFLLLMTVLTISIVCCTLDRTPRLWRTAHDVRVEQPVAFFDPERAQRAVVAAAPGRDAAALSAAVARAFRARHFRRQRVAREEGDHLRLRRPQPVPEAGHAPHARRPRPLPRRWRGHRGRRLRDGRLRGRGPDGAGAAHRHARQPAGQEPRLRVTTPGRRLLRRLQHRPLGLPRRPRRWPARPSASTTR